MNINTYLLTKNPIEPQGKAFNDNWYAVADSEDFNSGREVKQHDPNRIAY